MSYNNYQPPALVYFVAFVLAIHTYTFPFIVHPALVSEGPSWYGLDVSWQMALNYANINNWTWGKDVVFTYGPLGFFATRVGWGVSKWWFLLFDLLVVINFFFLFKDFLKRSTSKFVGVFILIGVMLTMNTLHGTDLGWLLLVFIFYWVYKTYAEPSNASFIMLTLLVLLAFYIKMNTGLIGIMLLAVHIVFLVFINKIKIKQGLLVLGGLVSSILVSAWILNVSLPGYISGSYELIKGYTATMSLNQTNLEVQSNIVLVYTLIKYLLIGYAVYLFFRGKFIQMAFLVLSICYVLLLKKQAYVRGDEQHLIEFFSYAPLVLIFGNLVHHRDKVQKYFTAGILVIVLLCLFFKTKMTNHVDDLFENRFMTKVAYLKQVYHEDGEAYNNQKDKRYIPPRILNEIGNAGVDIFPWDIEYILENKLNYNARPIFQGYAAYTPKLQQLNYDHYLTAPPEYIIYDYESVDNRYPMGDETLLHYLIIKNYTLKDSFNSNGRLRFLLKKNPGKIKPLKVNKIATKNLKISESVPKVEGSDMVIVFPEYNNEGKKMTIKARAPEVLLNFVMDNGHVFTYRTSTTLLEAGVPSDKMVQSAKDLITLQHSKDSLHNIHHMSLSLQEEYYQPDMRVEYYKVD